MILNAKRKLESSRKVHYASTLKDQRKNDLYSSEL